MKIGIIGSGISGLTAAYLLHRDHDIEVFEAGSHIGGHTNTIDVTRHGKTYAVDTGFIVFNRSTYPNFCRMMDQLGVASQPTEMTFSVTSEAAGLEYSPHNLNTLFIQRKNLISITFYRMIYDIFRFRKAVNRISGVEETAEIGEYLHNKGYSEAFIENFIVPLGSSLWSADPGSFHRFPLRTFVTFFKNHGFLSINYPFQWLVIKGGSQKYVEKLTAPFSEKIRANCAVDSVSRSREFVEITFQGQSKRFDHVIIAAHSDQALDMLSDPLPLEREILGAIPYQENIAVLHTDTSQLPRHREIWSSWNYFKSGKDAGRAILTYDMNILQSIRSPSEFCVTLNRADDIDPEKEIGRFLYQHPVFTSAAPSAQRRHGEISGVHRTHFCGAYWGYGFHEDGVKSALEVCKYFGKEL